MNLLNTQIEANQDEQPPVSLEKTEIEENTKGF